MTDKQPQTCYVLIDVKSNTQPDFMMTRIPKGDKSFLNGYPLYVTELPDRYIFTKEELEERDMSKMREAAEKAYCNLLPAPRYYDFHKLEKYLNETYPKK